MITCENVSYRYPNGQGIHSVNLTIPDRCVYLLAGMNGSGKSTLLKVLAGGLKEYGGTITMNGEDVQQLRTKQKRLFTISLSPQQPEKQFSLPTVKDELRFTAKVTKKPVDTELESHILNLLQLRSYLDVSPFDLPPVKRKLLSLAIAAVIPAPFIALDEPTAGIDRDHKPLVLQFIRFLFIHKGVIVVSHDIDTFLPLSTHIGIMSEGKITVSTDKRTFLNKYLEGHYGAELTRPFIIPRLANLLVNQPAGSVDELAAIINKNNENK